LIQPILDRPAAKLNDLVMNARRRYAASMTSPRLKTEIWFQAQLRLCDRKGIPVMVLRRGDRDAGSVVLKLLARDGMLTLYAQTRRMDGERAWRRVPLPEPGGEAAAEAYVAREVKRDPDLWVVEIEDRDGTYELDAPLA
jgi:hypothetical protein